MASVSRRLSAYKPSGVYTVYVLLNLVVLHQESDGDSQKRFSPHAGRGQVERDSNHFRLPHPLLLLDCQSISPAEFPREPITLCIDHIHLDTDSFLIGERFACRNPIKNTSPAAAGAAGKDVKDAVYGQLIGAAEVSSPGKIEVKNAGGGQDVDAVCRNGNL